MSALSERQTAPRFTELPPAERDPALESAWRRYFDYDTNSDLQRRTERITRLVVIFSGFMTGLLATLALLPGQYSVSLQHLWFYLGRYLLIATALLFFVSAVYSYMGSRTNIAVERLAYRLCTILIIKEIYLYRMGAGRYFEMNRSNAQRLLKQSVEAAEQRVVQMGVRPATKTLPTSGENLYETIRRRVYPHREDGFAALSPDQYIEWRAQSSKDYYITASQATEYRSARLNLLIGVILFAGVFFAVIESQALVLIALLSAITLNMYVEFALSRRVARVFYEPAAAQIDTELENWSLLPPEERNSENAARLAERVENILQFEGEMYVLSSVFNSPGTNINQQVIVTDLMTNGLSLLGTTQQQISPIRYAKNSIFISYRRSDSADIVGRIQDRLSAYFGRDAIFRDVETITAGQDFEKRILSAVGECRIMLTVIGSEWEDVEDEATQQRRLLNPEDYVRLEIAAALKRPDVIVVPLLVRGARMPVRDQLPEDLRELTARNALQVRSDPDFDEDIKRLITAIEISVRE